MSPHDSPRLHYALPLPTPGKMPDLWISGHVFALYMHVLLIIFFLLFSFCTVEPGLIRMHLAANPDKAYTSMDLQGRDGVWGKGK